MSAGGKAWIAWGLAAAWAVGWAQPTATELDGRWALTFQTENSSREGEVVLEGATGRWTTYPRGTKDKNDACVGRPLPLLLQSSDGGGFRLHVKASEAMPGCKDRQATLRRMDAQTLEGEFDNGRPLRLVRH